MKSALLCIDVGTKTIGVAVSDRLRRIGNPLTILPRKPWAKTKDALKNILEEYEIKEVIIGLPLEMDGTHGDAASRAMAFGDLIRKELNVETIPWDERLSTLQAEKAMFEQRQGRQTRASKKDVKKQGLDAVAAAIILQSYLDRKTT